MQNVGHVMRVHKQNSGRTRAQCSELVHIHVYRVLSCLIAMLQYHVLYIAHMQYDKIASYNSSVFTLGFLFSALDDDLDDAASLLFVVVVVVALFFFHLV